MIDKMNKAMNFLRIFREVYPLVQKIIAMLEKKGHGEEKKNTLLELMKVLWKYFDTEIIDIPDWSKVKEIVSETVDIIVGFWNSTFWPKEAEEMSEPKEGEKEGK